MTRTILLSVSCGFLLDLFLGDPECLTPSHPVVLMGHGIRFLEKCLRHLFPKTPKGELLAGLFLALLLPALSFSLSLSVLILLRRLCPPLAMLVQVIWCWRVLAVKDLRKEGMRVYHALEAVPKEPANEDEASLKEARRAVSRIVGRDTAHLTAAGVARAAVESVAENFTDGIVSPMAYLFLGGAPLGLLYKSISTMDSMVGYKNKRYLYFGRAAARLDDAASFLPSRIAALLLILSAFLTGQDGKEAFRIWRRDRDRHPSPNAAQCEAVVAGALHVQLAGPTWYFGELYEKPVIGDDRRPIEAGDIRATCRMVYLGSFLCFLLFFVIFTKNLA